MEIALKKKEKVKQNKATKNSSLRWQTKAKRVCTSRCTQEEMLKVSSCTRAMTPDRNVDLHKGMKSTGNGIVGTF